MSARAAERVKQLVDELLATRIGDLADQGPTEQLLEELESSLGEVQTFAQSLHGLVGRFETPGARRGRPHKGVSGARRSRPRTGRRGPGEFNATPFILASVKEAGDRGIRPREIVQQVVSAAPGHHVRPSALVSTILTRLKRRGEVRRRAGKWYPK